MSKILDDALSRSQQVAKYLKGAGVDARHFELADDLWDLPDWSDDEVLDLNLRPGEAPRIGRPGEPLALRDASTTVRWVQSALAATIEPNAKLSGQLDASTRLALQKLQVNARALDPELRAPVPSTGALDEATLATLEHITGTTRPSQSVPEMVLLGEPLFARGPFLLIVLDDDAPSPPSGVVERKVLPLGGKPVRLRVGSKFMPVLSNAPLTLTDHALSPAGEGGTSVGVSTSPGGHPPAGHPPTASHIGPTPFGIAARPAGVSTSGVTATPTAMHVLRAEPMMLHAEVAPTLATTEVTMAPRHVMALKKAGYVDVERSTTYSLTLATKEAKSAVRRWDYKGIFRPGQRPQPETPHTPPDTETPDGQTPVLPLALENTTTFERWAQSVLKATVAPALQVDGNVGPRSRAALGAFQSRLPDFVPGAQRLEPTGELDATTVAALGDASGVRWDPEAGTTVDTTEGGGDVQIEEGPPDPGPGTPPDATERAVATVEVDSQGREWNVVRMGGDEVRFVYNVKERKLLDGETVQDTYNVWSYTGAKTDLVTDADLGAIGYTPSGIKILRANALKESNGKFGAINSWDNQFISWGFAQFAGHAGTLANVLVNLKESPATAAAFTRYFVANGIDVDYGLYPYYDRDKKELVSRTGWHVVITDELVHKGDVAWVFMRTKPALIGTFMLAGNDKSIQLGQLSYWKWKFYDSAVHRRMFDRADFSEYSTSELGVGLGVRLFNWMPAYLRTWFEEIARSLQGQFGGIDLAMPQSWNPAIEATFITAMKDKRRKAKSGSWDTYGPELEETRGSFTD